MALFSLFGKVLLSFLQLFGTGWRKNRDEANKPIFWDGENQGGKALMRLRQQIKETHTWSGPYEEQVSFFLLFSSGQKDLLSLFSVDLAVNEVRVQMSSKV